MSRAAQPPRTRAVILLAKLVKIVCMGQRTNGGRQNHRLRGSLRPMPSDRLRPGMGLLAFGQLQVALDYDDLITAARFDRISRAQVPYGQNDVPKKRHDFLIVSVRGNLV